ncbi:DEAD/DEAH box helicase family protein [Pyrolobus fumarii]|uniref:DEAD/DEAH box helicase family protein n=1 Tax=Pyrolobus fumarii TaxID=54252 RepID=UPI0014332E77|nr:DEAD/DEAH box helicase family protein [Pyrolobus fumarii]
MAGLRVSLREYQREAVEWAVNRDGAVVVMPTGAGKTLVAAGWIAARLSRGECRKVLVLEPTRILVAQVRGMLSRVLENVTVREARGPISRAERIGVYRSARVVVATPEAALEDIDVIVREGFDCIVVDECHHTVGRDASVKVLERGGFRKRLGLSAYIPRSRRSIIERLIGEIREWHWSDPRIAPYVPPWIGEVYETPLNEAEQRILYELEKLASRLTGRDRALARLAQRWLVRDGALALVDSLRKPTRMAEILSSIEDLLRDPRVRPAHKLEWLLRVLEDHDNPKTIVFIDRVVVAEYVASRLEAKGFRVVKILGRGRVDVARALEEARRPETRVIVSTSAGEEGVDLPEAEMLVVWSNVASPVRFIQRHGRVRRAVGRQGPPRVVVYLVTPDSPDMDAFVESLEYALEAGVDLPVDPGLLDKLRERTIAAKILAVLTQEPMTSDWIAEVTGLARDRVERELRRLCKRGDVIYVHTGIGRVYAAGPAVHLLGEKLPAYTAGDVEAEATIVYDSISGGEGRRKARSWRDALKRLERLLPIRSLRISIEYPLPTGAYKLVNLNYTCLIDTVEKLEIILRNAFSRATLEAR